MSRTREQILAAMADAARLAPFDDDATWRDALFAQQGEGWALSRPHDPDRALLAALADEYVRLDEHRDTLPSRLHVEWLQDILGVPRLPVVPDRVIASATVDPKLAPAVVPAGTVLRGGKDAFGNERRYRTVDALTAHGATLTGVKVLVPGGPADGDPGLIYEAPEFPLAPAQTPAGKLVGPPAPHVMRISSPALGFTNGDMQVSIGFIATNVPGGPARIASLREAAMWRYPRADGTMSGLVHGSGSAPSYGITVDMTGGCVDPAGGDPWIECVIPDNVAVPLGAAFHTVKVAVTKRLDVAPDAAFVGEGAVDVTKEFEPFAATASAGDAFYVRSDETLGKQLSTLTISTHQFAPRKGGVHRMLDSLTGLTVNLFDDVTQMVFYSLISEPTRTDTTAETGADIASAALDYVRDPRPTSSPNIQWQRLKESGWEKFGDSRSTFGGATDTIGEEGSLPSQVGGNEGRYVRCFIKSGDLGWGAYQRALVDFATAAVKDPDSAPLMPDPITPAIFDVLKLSYTTVAQDATRVESRSGWRHSVKGPGIWQPFRTEVDGSGSTGMAAFGIDLPAGATGSSVSLYLQLDSPSPCQGSDEGISQWQWWNGSAWQQLMVADGSNRLRESGLVRFVAPAGWAFGCEDLTASSGRWIRFVTTRPDRIGTIHSAIPDAVVAEFVSSAVDPAFDPSSATALPPGTIKGTLAPIPGVKKVTNLASVRGRGPEVDGDYTRRAAALVRHRGRAINAWDYEQMVAIEFPEVAAVRCLPHTDSGGGAFPGSVGLVVVPDQPQAFEPRPSVSLAGRIQDTLAPVMPVRALLSVMCPLYVPVTVNASIRLKAGVAAITGKANIAAALETLLHPTGTVPTRWGVSLYASSLIAALERFPDVDSVQSFKLFGPGGLTEVVPVDICRGLYCSSGGHQIAVEEQL